MGKNRSLAYRERAAAVIADPTNAVGRIKKGYGALNDADGALLVMLFDTFPETGVDYGAEPLWVEIDSLAVPLFVASFERRGNKGTAVVLFEDFERAETAEMLIGKLLYREPSGTEEGMERGEMDFDALIGYELTDTVTGRSGTVRAFYDYPGNPLFGVDFEGREVLVPAVDEMIEVVSIRRRQLRAALPEGLLDL